MNTILDRIKAHKLVEVAEAKGRGPVEELIASCAGLEPCRGFAAAIRAGRAAGAPRTPGRRLRVIAEVKKASPSVGLIRPDFDPVLIAQSYERGGASAISCLTDEKFFQGSLEYLKLIRAAVALPILRKDFMVDPYQVWQARAAGADAILIIAGMNDRPTQLEIRETARRAGLDVLVEIHGPDELAEALALEPDVLGINNRNLRTEQLKTDLNVTLGLAASVPPALTLISESGIRSAEDVAALERLGIDGILVGEHLMREPDPGAAIAGKLGIRAS
ncbi:MAG: indole-3-glycerol phosphate synthase TrpC [Candidatus Sumerlaeia bacterium]